MAGKKSRNDVDGIRTELQNLSEAVWALREDVSVQAAVAAASTPTRRSPNGAHEASGVPNGVATDLAKRFDSHADQGIVVTRGVFQDAKGTRQYRWESEEEAATLLNIDDAQVAHLLAAIGHRQRLAILKSILNQPCSAADLVSTLNLGTTGAAYHHLNVLQAADLITQEERGVYMVQPHRVSAIFAILGGVASANDSTYSTPRAVTDDETDGSDTSKTDGGGKRKKRKVA